MIVVIDYCVGNVKSVCNALQKIGYKDKLSADPADIRKADGIILPGVAAFGFAVNALGETAKIIKEVALNNKPLLGICVGHQMLFNSSTELGQHTGLGLIEGTVESLPKNVVIPHMGWNSVNIPQDMRLFTDMRKTEYLYFAHSFHAKVTDKDTKVAYTDYGQQVVASTEKGNIFSVQFHPEKSSTVGLQVLKNFERICKGEI